MYSSYLTFSYSLFSPIVSVHLSSTWRSGIITEPPMNAILNHFPLAPTVITYSYICKVHPNDFLRLDHFSIQEACKLYSRRAGLEVASILLGRKAANATCISTFTNRKRITRITNDITHRTDESVMAAVADMLPNIWWNRRPCNKQDCSSIILALILDLFFFF
jgi:hypothetical protein